MRFSKIVLTLGVAVLFVGAFAQLPYNNKFLGWSFDPHPQTHIL
jgi:hypothetical protein